jgi:branched-chain amino acid transport system permease protein
MTPKPAPSRGARIRLAGLTALVIVGGTFPLWNSAYSIRLATGVALWAGLALSWNVICGYGGYISFGHVAFFGIGSYTTGILMQPQHGWPFFATLPVAAAVAAVFAAVAGWPALRLRGAYFAIATWAIAEAVREFTTVSGFTGGSGGLTLPVKSSSSFFYYAMVITAALSYVLCYFLLERSRFGFRVRAVRDNEAAARAQGIDATRVKIEAFMLSAAIPAVLGGINAYWITFINPDSVLNTIITDQMVVMVLVGGLGHAWGPALGAAVLYLINEQFLTTFGSSTSYIAMIGILVMLVVLFLPDGVVSLLGRGRRTRLVHQLLGRAADDFRRSPTPSAKAPDTADKGSS